MIVCLCYNVNETELLKVAEKHNHEHSKIIEELGITQGCGACEPHFKEFMRILKK